MKAVEFHSAWVLALMIAQLFIVPGARGAALLSAEDMNGLRGGAPGRCMVNTTKCGYPKCFIPGHGCKRCEYNSGSAQSFCVWFNVYGYCDDSPINVDDCGWRVQGEKCQEVGYPINGLVCFGGSTVSNENCDIKKVDGAATPCP